MPKYHVTRQHLGDKMYMPGDERDASAGDVQHLISNGVLVEAGTKADRPVSNKAERPVKTKAGA